MKKYKLDGTIYFCPVDLTLHLISGRWKGIVIWNLRERAHRFSELKRALVSINDKMLTQTLRELEAHQIVCRTVDQVIPSKVYYSLTDEGRKLLPIMQAMNDYGANYEF